MPTYELRLTQQAKRLSRAVPQATADAIQRHIAESALTAAEPLVERTRFHRPLAMAAAFALALTGAVLMQRVTDTPEAPKVVLVSDMVTPGRITTTVKDVARNAATAEDALLQEWRLIQSDLQKLRKTLGRGLTESDVQADSA